MKTVNNSEANPSRKISKFNLFLQFWISSVDLKILGIIIPENYFSIICFVPEYSSEFTRETKPSLLSHFFCIWGTFTLKSNLIRYYSFELQQYVVENFAKVKYQGKWPEVCERGLFFCQKVLLFNFLSIFHSLDIFYSTWKVKDRGTKEEILFNAISVSD